MSHKIKVTLTIAIVLLVLPLADRAQSQAKPLTNNDIIKMTRSSLAESTILVVVQASPTNFDTSPDALIVMKNAGVSPNMINAVVLAGNRSGPDLYTAIAAGANVQMLAQENAGGYL
jgi:hypothetical protein